MYDPTTTVQVLTALAALLKIYEFCTDSLCKKSKECHIVPWCAVER